MREQATRQAREYTVIRLRTLRGLYPEKIHDKEKRARSPMKAKGNQEKKRVQYYNIHAMTIRINQ